MLKGILNALGGLLKQNASTRHAYLCNEHTEHVSKMAREGQCLHFSGQGLATDFHGDGLGSFCGYRNIQMMVSYIIHAKATGWELFGDTFPTIFQIQDLIENAWDLGHNPQGRAETGGIKGTRKFIGTPEARQLVTTTLSPAHS